MDTNLLVVLLLFNIGILAFWIHDMVISWSWHKYFDAFASLILSLYWVFAVVVLAYFIFLKE